MADFPTSTGLDEIMLNLRPLANLDSAQNCYQNINVI